MTEKLDETIKNVQVTINDYNDKIQPFDGKMNVFYHDKFKGDKHKIVIIETEVKHINNLVQILENSVNKIKELMLVIDDTQVLYNSHKQTFLLFTNL